MKKIILFSLSGLLLLSFLIVSFKSDRTITTTMTNESPTTVQAISTKNSIEVGIKWYTLEEAMKANQKNPKKLFIDFYTNWCGWCKVMDKKTFTDAQVIEFMNENFYSVKFNAEQKEALTFKGKQYGFLKGGRKGIHLFAYDMLDRSPSYPAFVSLDKDLSKLGIIKGYRTPEQFLQMMQAQLSM